MPLGGFAVLLAAWAAVFGSAGAHLARRRALPQLSAGELALLGVATHKLTRIVTKDWVTAPLRSPFTAYRGSAGSGEVNETPHPLRRLDRQESAERLPERERSPLRDGGHRQGRGLVFANAARCLARELEAPMILTFAQFVITWFFMCLASWTLIRRVMASNATRAR